MSAVVRQTRGQVSFLLSRLADFLHLKWHMWHKGRLRHIVCHMVSPRHFSRRSSSLVIYQAKWLPGREEAGARREVSRAGVRAPKKGHGRLVPGATRQIE